MIEKQLDFSATKIAAVHVSVKIANNINLWKIHDTFYNALDLMHEVRQEATEEVERRNNHEKKKKLSTASWFMCGFDTWCMHIHIKKVHYDYAAGQLFRV